VNKESRATIPQLKSNFRRSEAAVDEQKNKASRKARVNEFDDGQAVGERHRNDIASVHALLFKRRHDDADTRRKLGVGEAHVAELKCRLVRRLFGTDIEPRLRPV
jgi:hypothetical protein